MASKAPDIEMEVDEDEVVESTTNNSAEYHGIMITATPEFKSALKVAAEAQDMSLSAFCRQHLAELIQFSGPLQKETSRKRKYNSEEERAQAQKERNKARRDVIKALLEKYGEDVKAQIEAAVNKN